MRKSLGGERNPGFAQTYSGFSASHELNIPTVPAVLHRENAAVANLDRISGK
jgi:hypothetical protein